MNLNINFCSTITATEVAARKIQELCYTNEYLADHVRFSVKGGGCSGYSYKMEWIKEIEKDDYEFASNNVVIVVDPKSYLFLKGTEIDYLEEGFDHGFRFKNPNETASCGCGESFSV